jgi:hypothetical protein
MIPKAKRRSLFQNDNILAKEIESWRSFAASLNSEEYKTLFNKMLCDCCRSANAINAREENHFLLIGSLCLYCFHSKK